jgi:hypothetical protein
MSRMLSRQDARKVKHLLLECSPTGVGSCRLKKIKEN